MTLVTCYCDAGWGTFGIPKSGLQRHVARLYPNLLLCMDYKMKSDSSIKVN